VTRRIANCLCYFSEEFTFAIVVLVEERRREKMRKEEERHWKSKREREA